MLKTVYSPGKLVALYPLDEKYGVGDISLKKNKPVRVNKAKVGKAKGPDGRLKGATSLPGMRNNYIEIPNDGKLDTKKSLTMAIWVRNLGKSGPLMQYGRRGLNTINLWFISPLHLAGSILSRSKLRRTFLKAPKRISRYSWTFVALTYDNPSGFAKLWINARVVRKKYVGRSVRLATKKPVRIGAILRNRNVLKADVACAQIYSVELTRRQMRKAMMRCFKRGIWCNLIQFDLFFNTFYFLKRYC